jgi:maltooligosyltrehalose synthase
MGFKRFHAINSLGGLKVEATTMFFMRINEVLRAVLSEFTKGTSLLSFIQ